MYQPPQSQYSYISKAFEFYLRVFFLCEYLSSIVLILSLINFKTGMVFEFFTSTEFFNSTGSSLNLASLYSCLVGKKYF